MAAADASVAAATVNLGHLQGDLTHELALGGGADGAYVYDMTDKRALFAERATAKRPPASVEKIYTATAALQLMSATGTLSTTVFGVGQLTPDGVWEGNLYLRGGGDPTFGSSSFIASHYGGVGTSITALATQLVRVAGIHHITGSVLGDESWFDSLRGEPSSGYAPDPFLEGTLSGLAFNRGASGSERGAHSPAAYAARELWGALKSDGVSIRGTSGSAPTPPGAVQLAQLKSPPLSALLGLTLPPSDNYFAETLAKDLGALYGGAGTTSAGAAVISKTVSSLLGVHPHIVDGSGLSPSDKTSPYEVSNVLAGIEPTPAGATLRRDLAVAGKSGTLASRMRGTAAQGRCQGKTGTLTGASNLAGYCQSENGHLLVFAIFTDAISTEYAHRLQDHMAITIAGY